MKVWKSEVTFENFIGNSAIPAGSLVIYRTEFIRAFRTGLDHKKYQ